MMKASSLLSTPCPKVVCCRPLKSYAPSPQVLSNPRSRELYDLSIRSGESRILRSAAAAGVRSG